MNFKAHDPIYPTLSDPTSTDVYYQNITRGEKAGMGDMVVPWVIEAVMASTMPKQWNIGT